MLSEDEFPQIDKNSNIQRTDLVGRFVELVLASVLRKKKDMRASGVMSNRSPGPRLTTECLSKTVSYKMEQISADFHLISSCNRRVPVQLPLRRKTSGCFNSLPSSHSYPAYEMNQISADFHLISRLSGSHLNCHSYKSH
jgi:hypothetical protein